MAKYSVSYVYQLIDQYSGVASRIKTSTDNMRRSFTSSKASARLLGMQMDALREKSQKMRGDLLEAAAIGYAFSRPVKAFMNFEDALMDVGRVVDNLDLKKFGGEMKRLAPELNKTAVELLQIAYSGGKLAVVPEELGAFVVMVSKVASAFDMVDETAGVAIGNIKTKLGLTIDQTNNLMNRVNYLADTTASNGRDMIEIIERLSGTFQDLKIPEKLVAGFASFANQIEVTPQLAASGMNMMFQRMKKNPGLFKKLLENPLEAVNHELNRLAKMSPMKRQAILVKQYGEEAAKFMTKAINKTGLLTDAMKKASSDRALGSIEREFELRKERLSTAMGAVWKELGNLASSFGASFAPALRAVAPPLRWLAEKVGWFIDTFPMVSSALGGLIATIVSARIVGIAYAFSLLNIQMGLKALVSGIMMTTSVVSGLRKAMIVAAVASRAFWAAVGGPITLILTGIAAVVAAMIYLYNNFQKIKGAVSGFFGGGGGPSLSATLNQNVAAEAALNKSTLDANINVTANNATVNKVSYETNMPKNVGLNVAGAR